MTTFHRLKGHWEKSRCFFLLQDLEFSKILLYYDNIKPEAAAVSPVRAVLAWLHENKIWNSRKLFLHLH